MTYSARLLLLPALVALTACTADKDMGGASEGASTGTGGASTGTASAGTGPGGTTMSATSADADPTSPWTATEGEGTDNTGGGVEGAHVEHACAPNDGPAVALQLRRLDNECGSISGDGVLRAVIYQAAPLAPGTYELGPGVGHWTYGSDDMSGEIFQEGTIDINSWDDDGVSGHFLLINVGGQPGYFELAPVCGEPPKCG